MFALDNLVRSSVQVNCTAVIQSYNEDKIFGPLLTRTTSCSGSGSVSGLIVLQLHILDNSNVCRLQAIVFNEYHTLKKFLTKTIRFFSWAAGLLTHEAVPIASCLSSDLLKAFKLFEFVRADFKDFFFH
jgi:hypothetical protein